MIDYYPMGFCSLQAGFIKSQHHLISVDVLDWLLMRYSCSTNYLLIDSVPGATPPGDTTDKETINLQNTNQIFTPDPTMTQALKKMIGVLNVGGKVNNIAVEMNNEHWKYSEQWNPYHLLCSKYDYKHA
jgi:hypothetical protein